MRKLLIILFIFLSINISAATYYIATTGNNAAAGTFVAPWATWQYGFSQIIAGDTLYIRGGTYQPIGTSAGTPFGTEWWGGVAIVGKDGTSTNRIVVMNYSNEIPILDGVNITAAQGSVGSRFGIIMRNCEYWHLKGLTVTGVVQLPGELGVGSIRFSEDCKHNILEQLVSHDNGGSGICLIYDADDNLILNCDSYGNNDPLSSPTPYNNSDGIEIADILVQTFINTIRGCRIWDNSDDGVDLDENDGVVIIEDTWSFNNGQTAEYPATGFKLGYGPTDNGTVKRIVSNCIAANNYAAGIDLNESVQIVHLYNNTIAKNGWHGVTWYNGAYSYGASIIRNNISYDNLNYDFSYMDAAVTIDHNSYSSYEPLQPVVTDNDFISVDINELLTDRSSDGSLPSIDCFVLKPESELIDIGINVGIQYSGIFPDLGYSEYEWNRLYIMDSNRIVLNNGNVIYIR